MRREVQNAKHRMAQTVLKDEVPTREPQNTDHTMDQLDIDTTLGHSSLQPRAAVLEPDSVLGEYRIISLLGSGGMGQVYEAEHRQMHKHYALKVLHKSHSSTPEFVARFKVEARIMADMDHPNIARVHYMGEQDGVYFLVMDYLVGHGGSPRSLEDELSTRGSIPQSEVQKWAIQICDGLAYAHEFKDGTVLHRDLKPSNVLLDPNGDARLTDFGLVKVLGAEYLQSVLGESMQLSLTGTPALNGNETRQDAGSALSLLGTYDYMSPEQKAGKEATARSDIYSFGVMLYRLLTGEKPEGAYRPPSRYGASKRWDRIVERCLQRNAGDRYGSVDALHTDIRQASGGSLRWLGLAALIALLLGAGYIGYAKYGETPCRDHGNGAPATPSATRIGDTRHTHKESTDEPGQTVIKKQPKHAEPAPATPTDKNQSQAQRRISALVHARDYAAGRQALDEYAVRYGRDAFHQRSYADLANAKSADSKSTDQAQQLPANVAEPATTQATKPKPADRYKPRVPNSNTHGALKRHKPTKTKTAPKPASK